MASLAVSILLFGGALAVVLVRTTERPARETVLKDRVQRQSDRISVLERDKAGISDALLGLITGDLVSRAEPTGSVQSGVYFALLYDATGTPTAANVALDWGQFYVGAPAKEEGRRQLGQEISGRELLRNVRPVVSRLRLSPEATIVLTQGPEGPRAVSVAGLLGLLETDEGRTQLLRSGYWVRVFRGEVAGLTQQYAP